jgi:hypothetical protein
MSQARNYHETRSKSAGFASEEYVASIFRVEIEHKQGIGMKQAART